MCGRYTRFAAMDLIYEYFGLKSPGPERSTVDSSPSWNVAPQTMQPVIRLNPETGEREWVLMCWGLVPFWSNWSKETHDGTVNARAEGILNKAAFRAPMRTRRCLVPIDSYFEWQVIDPDTNKKQPWAVGMANKKPFALAGIWDHWESKPPGTVLESYAVITCEPNTLLRPLHDRMPVIIHPDDYDRWLEPGDPNGPPIDLLKPFPAELMIAWPVNKDVGNVRNNRPDLVDPIEPRDEPDEPPMLF